jgi:hypothetical protein
VLLVSLRISKKVVGTTSAEPREVAVLKELIREVPKAESSPWIPAAK